MAGSRRNLKRILNLAAWVLCLGLLIRFAGTLYNQETDWQEVFASIDWGGFALATFLLLGGHLLRSQLGYVSHHYLRYSLTRWQSFRFFYLAQLAKYIPGGVWTFAAGVVAYTRNGMPLVVASAATTWEMLALLFTSLLISLLGAGLFADPTWTLLIAAGALAFIGGIILLLLPLPWRILARLRVRSAEKILETLHDLGNRRYGLLARLALWALGGWLLTGIGFYVLLLSFNQPTGISVGYATASYALAWTVGFLVIFAPTGLGPREALLATLLTPAFGPVTAFSMALIARLWWTIADAVLISAALLIPSVMHEKTHVQQSETA